MMNIHREKIHIGLGKKLKILFIADTHLPYADTRDDARKNQLALHRQIEFDKGSRNSIRYLEQAVLYAKQNCDLLLHAGDLIDFVSEKNIEIARTNLEQVDYFFAAGNHEFSLYVGEAPEDMAYKLQSLPRIQSIIKNDLIFASRIVHGVNIVSIDDSYYHISTDQLEKFRQELAKGYPVILMMHNPIHTDYLFDKLYETHKGCAYLIGSPEEKLALYSPDRQAQQRPNRETLNFIEYLKEQDQVKAVLAGHTHCTLKDTLYRNVLQYCVGPAFNGEAFEFELF